MPEIEPFAATTASPALRPPDLQAFSPEYHDLVDQALSLPHLRPYDFAINLLPGAILPFSWLYILSPPVREAMENILMTLSLPLPPSSSPLGASFFLMAKKDKILHPCIDYQSLNNITIMNKYPLPLLSSALGPLHGATMFTKLDLRNTYHLGRIREGDEWKTAFNNVPRPF